MYTKYSYTLVKSISLIIVAGTLNSCNPILEGKSGNDISLFSILAKCHVGFPESFDKSSLSMVRNKSSKTENAA